MKRFITDSGRDCPVPESCRVTGTSPALTDQIASIAPGDDAGIAITLPVQN